MVKSRKLKMTKSRKSRINKVRKSRKVRKSMNRKRGGGMITVSIYNNEFQFLHVTIDDSSTVRELKNKFVKEWRNTYPGLNGYQADKISFHLKDRTEITDNMILSECGIVNNTVIKVQYITGWTCPKCLKANPHDADFCVECGHEKHSTGPVVSRAAALASAGLSNTTEDGWSCPACTFRNKGDATKCEMCEQPREGPSQTQVVSRAAARASAGLPPRNN